MGEDSGSAIRDKKKVTLLTFLYWRYVSWLDLQKVIEQNNWALWREKKSNYTSKLMEIVIVVCWP